MKYLLSTAIAALCLSGAAYADPIYSNDFETGSLANLSGSAAGIVTAPNGSTNFLGLFGTGNSATLTLDTTNVTSLTLDFDLYAIMTVDGTGFAGGNSPDNPDAFVVTSGGSTLFNYSFANFPGDLQNYPVDGSPAQMGALTVNALGYGNFGDAEYSFAGITVMPTGATTTITFFGNTNQSFGDEAYGVDNLTVTGTNVTPPAGAVPEPATWAMMLSGFGFVGAGMRRRTARMVQAI